MAHQPLEFICECCGETYLQARPVAEALRAAREIWGDITGDPEILCDECYDERILRVN